MTIYNNPNPKKTNMRFSVYNNKEGRKEGRKGRKEA